jgi:2-phospho-L-lactate/phosphoenolpyruvate guanylyltransferase
VKAIAIVPVKRFAAAKQRLAPGLDEQRRQALVAAMLADVLEAIGAARTVEQTILVSGDPLAQEIAAEAGTRIEVVPDPADEGHDIAAAAGIARAEADGASCVALLPGDCPLLAPRDLDRLLTGLPAPYAAIVPDRHGAGTNALILAPPTAIAPAFGEGSRERHVASARGAGIPFAVEEIPSLGLDVDTPADLVALTRELEDDRGRARRTARALGL